jgi:hypothetical protein
MSSSLARAAHTTSDGASMQTDPERLIKGRVSQNHTGRHALGWRSFLDRLASPDRPRSRLGPMDEEVSFAGWWCLNSRENSSTDWRRNGDCS